MMSNFAHAECIRGDLIGVRWSWMWKSNFKAGIQTRHDFWMWEKKDAAGFSPRKSLQPKTADTWKRHE
jgi:hypothetical protein